MNMLEDLLNEARLEIAVDDAELEEARDRRAKIAKALEDAFPGSRTYVNGSIAHGDANTPLTDVDLGVVVGDADDYGPKGEPATKLMELAREAIRDQMADDYQKLRIEVADRKRSVLVRFGDPVTPGQADFTADVIVAIEHGTEPGLWIPNNDIPEGWDRSHPERHTELIHAANAATESTFARTVRLLKHWRDTHTRDEHPMCSWNLKALALECIADEPTTLLDALGCFFTHAADAIKTGLTKDPARVSGPIKLPLARTEAARRLREARDNIKTATENENSDRPALAQHSLSLVLPEIVPDSPRKRQMKEEAQRTAVWVPVTSAPLGTPTRAWAQR